MLLTVDAPTSIFITTICSWMASRGEAPPIISPVIAPGREIRPTVFALSNTGDRAITRALFTCWSVACRGVAPSANAVSTCKQNHQFDEAIDTGKKSIKTSYPIILLKLSPYQVQLCLDIISKSFHCYSGYSHCISNHHSGNWDDVSWSERENV